ncbi:hypothetical protein M527_07120 [Sphingobium indicum IP26]|uniref:hypothetical protein n=2 Tax=Sphingomonadaceae TaxID=41297 RepID=UPI0003762ED8|nr:hypothetical protein [Sphingobium indicum]EPR09888.1 hypothetical protein M527_07120 [Sphingobium indicum IP26]EQB05016.1 hypothetical protein L286_09635 [Sphingobium sp. HDIP04]
MAKAMDEMAILVTAMAKHAADIAHARRALYDAYIAEGFSKAQALELCKALTL